MREREKKFFRNWQPYSKYVHVASPVRRDMTLSRKMGPTFLSSSVTVGDPSQRPESQLGKKPVVSQRYVKIAHATKTTLH